MELVDDAWLALILPRLRNLRKISIVWPSRLYDPSEKRYVFEMLWKAAERHKGQGGQRSSTTEAPFSHLREAYATTVIDALCVDTVELTPFFAFPSMRKIGGYCLDEDLNQGVDSLIYGTNSPDALSTRNSCSSIMHIDLQYTDAMHGMRDWLRACREVRTFRLTAACNVPHEYVNKLIFENLAAHKDSLERVWVAHDKDLELEQPHRFIGSLKGFEKLKFLCINWSCLIEFEENEEETWSLDPMNTFKDVLPASLEVLALRDFTWMEDWAAEELIWSIDEGVFPELKVLGFDATGHSSLSDRDLLADLKSCCEYHGIVPVIGDQTYVNSLWPKSHNFRKTLGIVGGHGPGCTRIDQIML